jgi:hypothetical protein
MAWGRRRRGGPSGLASLRTRSQEHGTQQGVVAHFTAARFQVCSPLVDIRDSLRNI